MAESRQTVENIWENNALSSGRTNGPRASTTSTMMIGTVLPFGCEGFRPVPDRVARKLIAQSPERPPDLPASTFAGVVSTVNLRRIPSPERPSVAMAYGFTAPYRYYKPPRMSEKHRPRRSASRNLSRRATVSLFQHQIETP